jgi:hypothetical protein
MGMLHSDWKHRAEEVFERYRSEMPMSEIMQSALDRTIVGIASTKWKSSSTTHGAPPEVEGRISLGSLNPDNCAKTGRVQSAFGRFKGMLHRIGLR